MAETAGESRTVLLFIAIVENVGYRQLSIWWRLRGMISQLRGASAWGAMERKGFTREPANGTATRD